MMSTVPLWVAIALCLAATRVARADERKIQIPQRSVLIATIEAQCDSCAWDVAGREAVMLRVSLNGRYSQHVAVVRSTRAEYNVLLGTVDPGTHLVKIEVDSGASARELRSDTMAVARIRHVEATPDTDSRYTALAMAPFVYARPNTLGRFSDVPVFMWYEIEPTPRGTRYRYSVIFTNEDGGTPADRLMATWGRTTDIEYLYSVEVDQRGVILEDDFQGPEHKILPFRGQREGRHPRLWVSTDNNMVLDRGTTTVRYAPAPGLVALRDVSREEVMDAHPWLYAVMSQELQREGKIVPNARPGTGQIPDPRGFVYIEGCGETAGSALALAIRLDGGTETPTWFASDRGVAEYRVARDGCFRVAIPVPEGTTARQVRGLQAQAYTRPSKPAPPSKPAGPVRLSRINKVFMLDEHYAPGASLFSWQGDLTVAADGPAVELPVK